MQTPSSPNALTDGNVPMETNLPMEQVVEISRCDRWQVHNRLRSLRISCSCPTDGSLRVEMHHGIELVLIRSVIQQFVAPRQELVNWLERCWSTAEVCREKP
ncbi:Asr1405/Asl0597 family protein [Egbenema bharatensis]|uniref:Asr1405/Asl0597 family protein n=1 Tax=Egbenema bharatensis TaxID=3463334 RepID=UPI003A8908F1